MATFALLVPVFNEERTLNSVLDQLLSLRQVDQLVIINDGSKDGTSEVLRQRLSQADSRIRVVTHAVNRGKGAAIRSGLKAISADFAVVQDADTEYDPTDLKNIFSALADNQAQVVFGSRFLRPNPNLYPTYLLGNKVLTAVANVLGKGKLTDAYTCYKGMSGEHWRRLDLRSDGFEIEAEICMKVLLSGWRIKELPISYRPRSFSEGKKIRPFDALKGVLKMLRVRLTFDKVA